MVPDTGAPETTVVNNVVTPPAPSQIPGMLASSIPQEVHQAVQDQVHALAQKHVTVSYLLLGILGLTLVMGGFGAYFAAKWVDRALARAEKSEQLYVQYKADADRQIAALNTQLAASEQARAISDAKIADLQKQVINIAANAAKKKEEVLKPGKTASQAYADLAGQYTLQSPLNIVESQDKSEQELVFRVPDVQRFTASKIDLDAALQTISLKDEQIKEKDGQIVGLKSDLTKSGEALAAEQKADAQCQDALKQYKKIAKVSKFRRILNGAIKPAIFMAGFVAGYEAGKHF
jgi:hypothetical protein